MMKKIFGVVVLAGIMAGCVTAPKPDPAMTDKPTLPAITAYRSQKGGYAILEMSSPRAAVWQEKNRAAIDAATTDVELAKVVANEAAADALCAAVTPGYAGDPLKLTQLAAVSVYVMAPGREKERKLWVAALERARDKSATNDVDTFFRQQLLVCGYDDPVIP